MSRGSGKASRRWSTLSRGLAREVYGLPMFGRDRGGVASHTREMAFGAVAAAIRDVRRRRRQRGLTESGLLSIGRYTYGIPEVVIDPADRQHVNIGSFCSIAEDVRIFTGGNHRTDWISTFPFRIVFGLPGRHEDGCVTSKGDVIIGHDVWIGAGARILSGVHIGNGAVIGASSVVASDVGPYSIVVGNPARQVRERFSTEQIAALEAIQWWDWPVEKIIANVPILSTSRIDEFCREHPTSYSGR